MFNHSPRSNGWLTPLMAVVVIGFVLLIAYREFAIVAICDGTFVVRISATKPADSDDPPTRMMLWHSRRWESWKPDELAREWPEWSTLPAFPQHVDLLSFTSFRAAGVWFRRSWGYVEEYDQVIVWRGGQDVEVYPFEHVRGQRLVEVTIEP